jgi:hypothetical protein
MLFEFAIAGGALYFGLAGHGIRESARFVGRAVGRAAGGLRRARAASEQLQARAEAIGGSELQGSRREIAERMQRLRDIQLELAALTAMGSVGAGPLQGGAATPPPVFSDAELAEAMGGPPPPPPAAATAAAEAAAAVGGGAAGGGGAGAAARGAQPAYVLPNGRPVFAARFEQVYDAGSSVPRGAHAAPGVAGAAAAAPAGAAARAGAAAGGGEEPLAQRLAALALEPLGAQPPLR